MIYEYSLEDEMPENYTSCNVLWEKWDENAVRIGKNKTEMQCPHHDEHIEEAKKAEREHHPINIICPYGFWGFKHIIEQPLSAENQLATSPQTVETGGKLVLSIGVTKDIGGRDKHLEKLKKQMPLAYLDPNKPADTRERMSLMLNSPKIVYFLCHGEKENGQTYISIGEHDNQTIHKITPNTIKQWKGNAINLKAWGQTHPLIINGCGTADLRPGLAFDLVSTFANSKAGGVIGTEVSIHNTLLIQQLNIYYKTCRKAQS